ncbi:spore coat protein U domain-containing protein [Neisseria sicca]|jgi:putative lipoprotein|uniref:spore coat protein U domain-containing protein n=2 Tax=Neisseria TaxID=482 RepID=UPI000D2FA5CB|nr:spore coat protein U domain-containing protein [Neisseria sicca]MBF1285100.1 spore coat protein U domain-containing protein [Neisseria sp.]
MKTRFTLTSLALASLMMMGNTAMAETKEGNFNVHLKLTGTCEVLTTNSALNSTKITTEDPSLAGADIDFSTRVASSNSTAITQKNVGGMATGLNIRCSKNTLFTVGLEPQNVTSNNGEGTMWGISRTSKQNNDTISYQLQKPVVSGSGINQTVQETNSNTPWGNSGTDLLSLTGQGLSDSEAVKLPVYATVKAGELNKFIDTYQDQVKVTLSY